MVHTLYRVDKKRILFGIIALLVFASIVLDQTGVIAKLGNLGTIVTFALICLAIIAFSIWLNNRAVLVAAVVFSVVLIFSKLVGLGYIMLPAGDEWYFKALDLVMPSIVLGIAVWQRKRGMLLFAVPMLCAFLTIFLVNVGLLGVAWSWAFLAFFGASVLVLIWLSSTTKTLKTPLWAISMLGTVAILAIILFSPVAGPYTLAWLIFGLAGATLPVFLLLSGRGGLCAVAAIVLSLAMPVGLASPWTAQIKDLFFVAGLAMVAFSMAPQKDEYFTKEDEEGLPLKP